MTGLKKVLWLSLLAVVCLALFVIAMLPASLVVAEARLPPEITVTAVSGTVWQGEVDVVPAGFPPSTARWSLSLLPLFSGTAAGDISVDGQGHEIRGAVTATRSMISVADATGTVTAAYANAVAERYGLEFGGELSLVTGTARITGNWPELLSAELAWTGGEVVNRLGGEREAWLLPPLSARIDMEGNHIVMNVDHAAGPVARITLKRDGWIAVSILARLFIVANLPWPTGQAPDEVALELEQRLWNPV